MKITVWHGVGHDNSTTTEITLEATTGHENRTNPPDKSKWLAQVKADGGFWVNGSNYGQYAFVPWHRINYIEVER